VAGTDKAVLPILPERAFFILYPGKAQTPGRTSPARNLTAALNDYYSPLQKLLTLLSFPKHANDRRDRTLRAGVSELKPEKNVPVTRNPYEENLGKMLEAQDDALVQIDKYLSRSWISNFLIDSLRWLRS